MYSLRLQCRTEDAEFVSAELWECGTDGIREIEFGDKTLLIAGFAVNDRREELMGKFSAYTPEWEQEDAIDWVQYTRDAWPPREVGKRLFLTPPWREDPAPDGRIRIVHNPGLACGTGEHPCTQLALEAIEETIWSGMRVVDIGTGSGLLAIAALRLGAKEAVGTDIDETALTAARENFKLNGLAGQLLAGSADCLRDQCADLTIANISGTVLLGITDDLVRITKRGGSLILTGFPESEVGYFRKIFPGCGVTAMNEWRCVVVRGF